MQVAAVLRNSDGAHVHLARVQEKFAAAARVRSCHESTRAGFFATKHRLLDRSGLGILVATTEVAACALVEEQKLVIFVDTEPGVAEIWRRCHFAFRFAVLEPDVPVGMDGPECRLLDDHVSRAGPWYGMVPMLPASVLVIPISDARLRAVN